MGVFGYMGSPLVTERGAMPSAERQELVVVAGPFSSEQAVGGLLEPGRPMTVATVNGIHIRSLAHLVERAAGLEGRQRRD